MAEHDTLAALAGQLASVRGDLDKIRTSIAAFDARLAQETGPVMVLQSKVKTLSEQVEALQRQMEEVTARAAKRGGQDDEPTVVRWDGHDGQDSGQLNAQSAALQSWVESYLRVQYPGPLRHLRPCWPNHREALWELGTLRAQWARVFDVDGEPTLEAVEWWHERWLPGVLTRLRKTITCQVGECSVEKARKRAAVNAKTTAAAARIPGPAGLAFRDRAD